MYSRFKKLTCLILTVLIAIGAVFSTSAAQARFQTVVGVFDYDYVSDVIKLLNNERKSNGLGELTFDARLTEAAMIRSAEIYVSFSHTRPNGDGCETAFEWEFCCGENIAAGQRSPEYVHTSWMNSEGHRRNILNSSFRSVGIGCFYIKNDENHYYYYWCEIFNGGSGTGGYSPYGKKNVSVDVSLTSGIQSVVGVAPDSVTLDKSSLTLSEGESFSLTATVLPEDAADKSLVWETDNSYAAVVNDGTVTAVRSGNALITATTFNGIKAVCRVTVVQAQSRPEPTYVTDPWELPEIPVAPPTTNPPTEEPTEEPTQATSTEEPTAAPTQAPTENFSPTQPQTAPGYEPTDPLVTEPYDPTESEDYDVLLGDVNSDGTVDAKDRIVLTRYLSKWAGYDEIDSLAADVNYDGFINAKDRIILTRHLSKWHGYETLG